jgi:ribonuclease HI
VDVLKRGIVKLQKRVLAGVATLLVKVKGHRGDPLNEEVDIRTEMGLRKEHKEVGWNTQPIGQSTDGRWDNTHDQPHGPTPSEIDFVKRWEKSKNFDNRK